MPGPAPKSDANRRRSNAPSANTLQLPAAGRPGDPPAWPLRGEPQTTDERDLWAELWATPHGVAWERLGWTRIVARYVQVVLAAESGVYDPETDSRQYSAALLAEVRQLEDRLGLSPMAMLRLRWEVTGDDLAPAREAKTTPTRRLRVVDDRVAGT